MDNIYSYIYSFKSRTTLAAISTFLGILCIIIMGEFQNKMYNENTSIFISVYVQMFSMFLFSLLYFLIKWFNKSNNKLYEDFIKYYNMHFEILKKSVFLTPIFLIAMIISNYGFKYISVALNNSLYQSNIIFTFLIVTFIMKEKITYTKFLSTMICTTGIIYLLYISADYSFINVDPFDTIVIASGLAFAIFGCLYNHYFDTHKNNDTHIPTMTMMDLVNSNDDDTQDYLCVESVELAIEADLKKEQLIVHPEFSEEKMNMMEQCLLIYGVIGLVTFLTFWPFLIFFHLSKLQVIYTTTSGMYYIAICCVFFTMYHVLFGYAYSAWSPLKINMLQSIQIPLSMLADYILHGTTYDQNYFLAVSLILLGFFGVVFDKDLTRLIDIYFYFRIVKRDSITLPISVNDTISDT